MKNKALLYVLLLSLFSSISFAAVDCSDPKNRPRMIAGMLVGGKKECDRKNDAKKTKLDLDVIIGRNPVTGKVTSKAELLGGNKATNNLEKAQLDLEAAEEIKAKDDRRNTK